MSSNPKYPDVAERDGTSQNGRVLQELDPKFVQVDEQTSEELLAFARSFGAELTYFDATNTARGNWSGFVSPGLNLDTVIDFLANPDKYAASTSPDLFRPHFVLFLAFLKLLEQSRAEINQLTGRHLDYYYRQILRMVGKPSIPDHVNLIVNLTPTGKEVMIKAGSAMNAGPDSLGRDRIYVTDTDLVVNHTQIAKMSSLFIDRRRTTLRQVPTRFANDRERAVEALFEIALGSPLYFSGTLVNYAELQAVRALLTAAEAQNYMTISDMRDLTTRVALRPAAPAEWTQINSLLQTAGRLRPDNSALTIDPSSTDFYNNVTLAFGTLDLSTLPQISIIDDLADQRTRSDVAAFIQSSLYFANVDDFAQMIQLKRKFESDWAGINAIIEAAGQGQHNDTTWQLNPTDVTAVATNLQTAIGVTYTAFQASWANVLLVESTFFMAAELYAFVIDEITNLDEDSWNQSYAILESAHVAQLRKNRQAELLLMCATPTESTLYNLAAFVLGETPDPTSEDPSVLDRLVPYLGQADTNKLSDLAESNNWDRVCSLLEVAERNRLGEPAAEMVEWRNLYPAVDATKVAPTRGVQDTDSKANPRFAAFGVAQPLRNATPAPDPVIGWAISSPLLVLSEGTRTITLTLGFSSTKDALGDIFCPNGDLSILFQISTAKGYIPCTVATPVFGDYATLCPGQTTNTPQGVQFVITLPTTVDGIVAPPAAQVDADSPWPVLRLMMRPIWDFTYGQHVARYPQLSELQLLATYIKVEVSGLKAVRIQNDEKTLDAKRPFEIFGRAPPSGSHFALGHPEICAKRLDSLQFDFQWIGAPDNPSTYYANYGLTTPTQFTTKISLIDGAIWTTLTDSAALFGATGATAVSIAIGATPFTQASVMPADPLLPTAVLDDDLVNWPRYVQWELNSPDFQHTNYQNAASAKALALTIDAAQGTSTLNATDYQVPPPYTPKIKSMSLSYATSIELRLDDLLRDESVHRVLHIHPFGACSVETERTGIGVPFLPPYDNDGELYIALSVLVPPESLSIYIQVSEGSSDPDLPPQPLNWSCLDNNRWVAIDSNVVSDTTRGLCNSGIIALSLPTTQPSTRIRGDYYWLRATMTRDTPSACDIVAVYTQGVSATFSDHGNAPDHFSEPLPAGSIQQLVNRLPDVAGISQPYTSYGGRMAEPAQMFYTRVSERLRHKGRALSMWDYERLILDRFPELHKVKCIPAVPSAPGKVTIIIIPDIRNKIPFEPFAPKAPANLLADISDYVTPRAPSFADLTIKNADYISVRVRLGVRFRGTANDAFYKQQLNDDLNRFLSPWAYDEGADIAIGGRMYASSIVDFVDRRDYVDYVAGIKLFHSEDGQTFRPVTEPPDSGPDGYYVGTTAPDQVLVATRSHEIDVLTTADYEESLVTGIGFMKLESISSLQKVDLDFPQLG